MMTYYKMLVRSVVVIKVLNKNTSQSFVFWVVRHLGAYYAEELVF